MVLANVRKMLLIWFGVFKNGRRSSLKWAHLICFSLFVLWHRSNITWCRWSLLLKSMAKNILPSKWLDQMMRWRMLRRVTWACKWRGHTWWLAESACVQTKAVRFFWGSSLSSGTFSSFSCPFLSILLALSPHAHYILEKKSASVPASFLQFQKWSSH